MNPLNEMVRVARSGGNPMMLMQQMASRDPRVGQAMQMMQGKSPAQLRQMCENMARERGIDLNGLAQQLGIRI